MNNKHIQIGFSPCPNDTFIFDALINNKIDTEGIIFEAVMEDVQTLNQWAIEKKLPVTKLSYGVLPLVVNHYMVLNCGSALGTGVGPLLLRNKDQEGIKIEECFIAIPGENTTAHLLFSLAYPGALKKVFMRYDEIEGFVAEGKGLGVIIHENRFTYHDKGLIKLIDLGEYWEKKTNNPIPLGGIVIKRTMPSDLQLKMDALIRKSIEFAWSNYPVLTTYITKNAREMSEDVMRNHIDLYVNKYSLGLGIDGKEAVKKIISVYNKTYHRKESGLPIFVTV